MTTIPVFENGGFHANVIEPQIKAIVVTEATPQNYSTTSSTTTTTPNSSSSSLYQQGPPPPVPLHETNAATTPLDYFVQMPTDQSYLQESSLEMAMLASQKRYDRLNMPADPKFPPVSVENINQLREEAKTSQDPDFLFFFARFLLLECLKQLKPNPQEPDRIHQLKENITNEAIRIIKKLASHRSGFTSAQFFLANAYGSGLYGLKSDPEKAFALYIQASKQQHPESTYRAAVCYELGLGTRKDQKFAMQFYRKAANLSDPSAMYKLGHILLNGLLGQSKNPPEAISWFSRGAQIADENHPQALHELGLAYEKTEGDPIPSVIPDLNYAHQLFSQAALLGYAPSQYKLGLAYENGLLNCPIDPKRSIAWYSRAAEQGHSEAELALSGWYLTGSEGVLIQNDTEAYLWAKKASKQGLAKAEYAVGYYTETGVGVPRNLTDAKKWYTKAAEHGDLKARQRLLAFKDEQVTVKRRPTRDKNGKPNSKDTDCNIM